MSKPSAKATGNLLCEAFNAARRKIGILRSVDYFSDRARWNSLAVYCNQHGFSAPDAMTAYLTDMQYETALVLTPRQVLATKERIARNYGRMAATRDEAHYQARLELQMRQLAELHDLYGGRQSTILLDAQYAFDSWFRAIALHGGGCHVPTAIFNEGLRAYQADSNLRQLIDRVHYGYAGVDGRLFQSITEPGIR